MKFYALTASLIAAVALTIATLCYWCLRTHGHTAEHSDALTWLRTEFTLSPEQLARIETSHEAYSLVCAEHCALIREQREAIQTLETTQAPAEQIAKAQEKAQKIDAYCVASVEAHAREIATIIGGKQGERYLAIILPKIAHFDHAAAPDLMLNSARTDASPTCH